MVQDVLSRPLSRDCRETTRHSYVAIYQLSHIYINNHIIIYVYFYIYICMCMCMCTIYVYSYIYVLYICIDMTVYGHACIHVYIHVYNHI